MTKNNSAFLICSGALRSILKKKAGANGRKYGFTAGDEQNRG